jgi:hypothetical protein
VIETLPLLDALAAAFTVNIFLSVTDLTTNVPSTAEPDV